jgi:hypothetical protein
MNIAPGPQESVRLSWFRQLDSQLVIVIASTVLISFIVLGGVISARTRSSMLGRELNYLSTLSSTYTQHLSQQVDKTRSIVNAYSFDNNLREALLEGIPANPFFCSDTRGRPRHISKILSWPISMAKYWYPAACAWRAKA